MSAEPRHEEDASRTPTCPICGSTALRRRVHVVHSSAGRFFGTILILSAVLCLMSGVMSLIDMRAQMQVSFQLAPSRGALFYVITQAIAYFAAAITLGCIARRTTTEYSCDDCHASYPVRPPS